MRLALVLGGANVVWEDAAAALDMAEPDYVFACNDIGTRWAGPLEGWATLHPEKMPGWRAERARRGFLPAREHIGHEMAQGIDRAIDYRFPGMTGSGSSGLFAVKAAMEKADRVILAGVPIDPTGAHFFDAKEWADWQSFIPGWQNAMPHIKDKVRSMSGWTRKLLGAPSPQWLAG